jgi:hypothetical protein
MTAERAHDIAFPDPRSVTVNLPPALAAKVALVCARVGVTPQALIIDVLADVLCSEVPDSRHAVSAA